MRKKKQVKDKVKRTKKQVKEKIKKQKAKIDKILDRDAWWTSLGCTTRPSKRGACAGSSAACYASWFYCY